MSVTTINTKEIIEVGKVYLTRNNRRITIRSISPYPSSSYAYSVEIEYTEPNDSRKSGATNIYYQLDGHMEKGGLEFEWDIMSSYSVKAEFGTVESVSSAFKFMSLREKELRA